MKEETKTKISKTYDKFYHILYIIPFIILALSLVYLISFYYKNNDIIYKDVSLTGGTTITINDNLLNTDKLKSELNKNFEISVRQIYDLRTREQIAVIVETTASPDGIKPALEKFLGYKLTDENSSIEFTGSSLSGNFYTQLRFAIIIAFILMSIVVFIIFRSFVPSITVILCAFADIVMTVAVADLLGIRFSTAGIVAVLMLIGYSVDTDILLTTRVIKRKEGSTNSQIYGAFKTGITMTLTSVASVFVSWIIMSSFSEVMKQIFTILMIGLLFDIINTWGTNASIIKLYLERKHKSIIQNK